MKTLATLTLSDLENFDVDCVIPLARGFVSAMYLSISKAFGLRSLWII